MCRALLSIASALQLCAASLCPSTCTATVDGSSFPCRYHGNNCKVSVTPNATRMVVEDINLAVISPYVGGLGDMMTMVEPSIAQALQDVEDSSFLSGFRLNAYLIDSKCSVPDATTVVDGSIADLFTAATTGQLRYMRPRDVGLPDGVMTCFQITVSAKHSLDLVALENAARGLDIAKIVIYWVVPRDSFREFNRKQTFGPQLVFEQRVLSLAAPRNPFTEQEMQERLQKAELSKLTTGDEQLLKQEIDDLKLRYLVMKSFEEQDVKDDPPKAVVEV
ncbi:unnamed protein product [Effrenium voratum]|nr:unnamed protein product [Effrenium voratum]